MFYDVALIWAHQFLLECDGIICDGVVFVFLSVFFDQFGGLVCQSWAIVPSTPTRDVLFVGRSRTGHSIRLWRGCSPRLHRADMRTAYSLPSSG